MNQELFKILLEKYQKGTLSDEEHIQMLRLLDVSDNFEEFKEISAQKWESIESVLNYSDDNAWKKILEKNQIEDREKDLTDRTKTKRIYVQIFKYAALFIGAFLISWVIRGKIDNSQPDTIEYCEVSVDYGSKSALILPDGTTVKLNSGSKLRYPQKFSTKSREVSLEGEAYFEVVKNPKKPFIVQSGDLDIRVLGTKFNLKAYSNDKYIETTLITGVVEVAARNKGFNTLMLKPAEQAVYNRTSKNVKVYKKDQKSLANYISWKDNFLVFKEEKFDEVIKKLERWYNVKIVVKQQYLKDLTFTGTFENETIEQALEALRITTPFTYSLEKNTIIINRK